MIHVPDMLDADTVRVLRERLGDADFGDGRRTVPEAFADRKQNLQFQFPSGDPSEREILDRVASNPLFQSWSRPMAFTTPAFNRFDPGMSYGPHLDTPIASGHPPVRRDLSVTIFLNDPSEYDGGELVVEAPGAARAFKLPPGHAVAYETCRIHEVRPVTRGSRLAALLWVQSFVADDEIRRILFDLDAAIEGLQTGAPDERALLVLHRARQNLERRFSRT